MFSQFVYSFLAGCLSRSTGKFVHRVSACWTKLQGPRLRMSLVMAHPPNLHSRPVPLSLSLCLGSPPFSQLGHSVRVPPPLFFSSPSLSRHFKTSFFSFPFFVLSSTTLFFLSHRILSDPRHSLDFLCCFCAVWFFCRDFFSSLSSFSTVSSV